jgi:pimeloyl-ACP methyl ester carboxylesterase
MDMLAKDTKEFLDALGIKEKVNIVGASMGGIIAQAFIHNYPEMVKKLVLVCSGVSGGDPHYVQMENEYIQRIANPGQTAEEKVKTIIDIFYHPDYIKNHPEVRDAYLNRKVENSNPQAYFWQLQACIDQRPYYEWLKDIKCPVLIMHGEGDRVWKLKNAQVLKDGIGDNAELYIMKDAEHMFFQEKPEEFNAKLLDFLKK